MRLHVPLLILTVLTALTQLGHKLRGAEYKEKSQRDWRQITATGD